MNHIEISHVTKRYKNGVVALDDISFTAGSGVFGLLGHNGAGKSTLMKALVTVLQPTAGTINICGFDTKKQGDEVRKRIGYLPQELTMYPSLSAFDFVNYMAQLKGVHDKKEVKNVLEQVEMLAFSNRKIGQLSGGMKRRIDGKVKVLTLNGEEQLKNLQKQTIVISTTYENNGLTARILDENMIFTEAVNVPATLEDAYVSYMGGNAHA